MRRVHEKEPRAGTFAHDRRSFTVGLGAALLAASATRAGAVEETPDAVRDLLRQRVDREKRSLGMAVGIVEKESERIAVYGRQGLTSNRPVSARTIFEIGSITKVFTALLLAQMVRNGAMAFDDPADRHLPGDYRLPAVDGRRITLADLATHTSGLPRFPPFPGTRGSPEWVGAMARYSEADLKDWLAGFKPPRAAGAAWEYSNAGFALLGLALAHRAGQPFEALLDQRVTAPLALRDTTFRPTAAMAPRVAEGHAPDLRPLPPFDGGVFLAAGALRSSVKDMARFAGRLLSPSAPIAQDNALLLTIQRPSQWIAGKQALGWEVLDGPGGTFVSKDGVTFGQGASLVLDPAAREAVVVLSNTQPDLGPSTLSGGGIGAADLARHLLRPGIPLNGEGGARY